MGAVILRDVTQRKMIETENQRRLELIRGLSRDYESVYVVDLETDSYDIYRVKEEITAKYRNAFSPSYTDAVENFAYKGVYRQDRENFMNHLSIENAKKVLSRKSSFMFTFRSGNTGMPQYYQAKAVRIGSPDSIQMLLGFANIEEERQEELDKQIRSATSQVSEIALNKVGIQALWTVLRDFQIFKSMLPASESSLMDDSLLQDMTRQGAGIITCAALLFVGMVDQATTFAENKGGGGGHSHGGWGRDKDEDDRAWIMRCLARSRQMMAPAGRRIKR